LQVRVVKINFNCRPNYPNLCRYTPHKYFLVVEVEKDKIWKALLLSALAATTSKWLLLQLRFKAETDMAVKVK